MNIRSYIFQGSRGRRGRPGLPGETGPKVKIIVILFGLVQEAEGSTLPVLLL